MEIDGYIWFDADTVDAAAIWCVVFGNGEFQAIIVEQRYYHLHRTLAVGFGAYDGGRFSVLQSPGQNFRGAGAVFVNPIWEQAYAWNEQRMSAAMDSYLNGYKDPRLQVFFVPAAADGKYHGVRTGIVMSNNTNYIGDRISNVNVAQTTPVLYMAAAEAFFLRAEAALRGWDMRGTAKSFYENGIRLSMAEHGVNSGVDNYIADNTSKPANFVDRSGRNNGANTKSRITIAWEDNADFETNLERIITQKWIAGWPNSPEAWAEYRRTGYPYLFPVVVNNSNGTVDTDLQIRRMQYPSTEYDTNADAVSTGVAQLGGPDTGGTRLWWDKKNH